LKRCISVNILLILFFSLLVLAAMGYHPGPEDDGVYLGARIGKAFCPTRNFPDASLIHLRRRAVYGIGVLQTTADSAATRLDVCRRPIFNFPPLQLKRRKTLASLMQEEIL
jgi:hypothetical protein